MEAEQATVVAVSCNGTYSFTKPVRDEIFLIAGVGVEGDVHAGLYVKHRGRVRSDPTQPNFRQVHLIQRELFDEVGEKGYDVEAGNLGENLTTSGIDLLGLPRGTILRFGPPGTGGPSSSGTGNGTDGNDAGGGAGGNDAGGGADGNDAAASGGTASGGTASGGSTGGGGGTGGGGTGGGGVEALAGVLEIAAAAKPERGNPGAAVAIAAAAARDRGDDPRPAIVVAGLRNPCGQINGFRDGLLKEVLGKDSRGNVVRKAGVMAVVLRGGAVRAGDVVTVELPPLPHAPLEAV